jgi:hypothetical protein
MPNTKFNINNSNSYTYNNSTIVVGEIEVDSPAPNSITLSSIEKNNCNVILSNQTLSSFKTYISNAPVTSNSIYVYDNFGNRVGRYENNRKNNESGSLNILTEPVSLLSNIVFPDTSSTIYLPLLSYNGLTDIIIPEMRKELFKQDMEELSKKTDLSKIHLIINESLSQIINNINEVFPFGKISIINDNEDHIHFLVQYICGKIVSGQASIFQGMLKFGNNFDVISANSFNNNDKQKKIILIPRTNGIVQMNLDNNCSKTNFIILLNNKTNETVKSVLETTTDTICKIDSTIIDNTFEEHPIEYINNFINTVVFNYKLSLNFIKMNPVSTVEMLFIDTTSDKDDNINQEFTNLIASVKHQIFKLSNKSLCMLSDFPFNNRVNYSAYNGLNMNRLNSST